MRSPPCAPRGCSGDRRSLARSAEGRLLRDLVDRVLRGFEVGAVDLAVELDRVDLPPERDEPLDVRIAALARRWKDTGLAEVVGPPAAHGVERQCHRCECHDDVQDHHGLGATGRCEEKTLARPFASTASTSKGSGSGPSIPGDPIGIPGSARPAIRGRFSRSRFTSSAGTCPSTKYPPTSAVWHEASRSGTPCSRFTRPTSGTSVTWTSNP